MLRDVKELLQELVHRIADSRLSALAVLFTGMFLILIGKLFQLQIVEGQRYLDEYVQMTEKTVATPGQYL